MYDCSDGKTETQKTVFRCYLQNIYEGYTKDRADYTESDTHDFGAVALSRAVFIWNGRQNKCSRMTIVCALA